MDTRGLHDLSSNSALTAIITFSRSKALFQGQPAAPVMTLADATAADHHLVSWSAEYLGSNEHQDWFW
jgi:hypothetical protein